MSRKGVKLVQKNVLPQEFLQARERYGRGDFQGALMLFRKAHSRQPNPDTLCNIGLCLRQLDRLDEARATYLQILAGHGAHIETHINLGGLLMVQQDWPAAEQVLRRAFQLAPDHPGVLVTLSGVLFSAGQLAEAEALARRAIERAPDTPQAHINLAQVLLLRGELGAGLAHHEWRLRTAEAALVFDAGRTGRPRWNGEDLTGKTLLGVAEQGLGDVLIFVRYGELVRRRGGRFIVVCTAPLKRLLATCPALDGVFSANDATPAFDCHVPLGSLPHLFGTSLDTIPGRAPYLAAEPAAAERWRSRLAEAAGGARKVGLIWAGSTKFKGDVNRSPRLQAVTPILETPGVHFFALQLGDGRADLDGWTPPANFTDLAPEIADFADTAAIMANLDLVLTSCTSTAHLAGAMGVPTWVMLSSVPYWLWHLEGSRSPWYPSVRLYRQARPLVWDGVVAEVRRDLGALASSGLAPEHRPELCRAAFPEHDQPA